MDREYDLYERMTDGSLNWREFARGLEATRRRLRTLTFETGHQCFGVNLPAEHVIGVNPNDGKR